MNRYLVVLFLLITSSCCKDSIESDRYVLSDNEKEFIPYTEDQKVKYKYSNGFEFYMNVTNVKIDFQRTETEHCGEKYISFETKVAKLQSNIPELNISASIMPSEFYPIITITVNNSCFQKDVTKKADFDTLVVDGNRYIDVYQFENKITDTTIIYPHKVLYNQTKGIIQIRMTDGEKFTIIK
jgi:hypothetical protein